MIRKVLLLTASLSTAALLPLPPASAAQFLIPSPYPNAAPGAQPLDPEPQGYGGPQRLIHDPYPQLLGVYAQGNPPITRRHWHQRLVPTINERKYRVDQIPQYYN